MKKTMLSLSIATLLATPAVAQEQDSQVVKADERIKITASRTEQTTATIPATVTVIDGADLRQQLASADTLSDVLGNLVPAFSPSRQKLTSSGETLRGREPLYLIDGVPQSNPLRNGARASYTIDPLMIERVEIIHGASAIQGMGASGGIINIVTKSAEQGASHEVNAGITAPTSETSEGLSYRTGYLFRGASGDVSAVAGVQLRSTGMYVDGNGQLIGVDMAQGDTMDSESYDVFAKLGYRIDANQSLEVMLNHFDMEGNGDYSSVGGDRSTGEPTLSVEEPAAGEAPRNKVTTTTVTYRNTDVLGADLNWQLFSQDFSALYGGGTYATFQDPAYGDNIFDQSRNDSQKYGSRLTMNWNKVADLPIAVSSGVDYLRDSTFQELAQTGRKWVPETTFDNWAPFAQVRYRNQGLTLSGGVRYEYGKLNVDDFTTLASYGSVFVEGGEPSFNELLPNVGAVYELTGDWRVFASYSEGFSMPDVGRVLRGISQPNLSVASFLDLQPVIADNQEIGIEYRGNALNLSASYFTSDSDLGARLQADADGFYSVKRERTEISGIELSANYAWSAYTSFGMNYAKTDGEYDSDGDDRVDSELGGRNIAPERANLYWEQQWGALVSSRLQYNMLFDRDIYSGAQAINNFDGYQTLDLQVLIETMDYGQFTVGVENLLDEYYFTYYAQTAGSDSRNFTGRGRTLSLNWNYSF
ncbi:TonB-dependent receptor [Pseudidiomarina terrestris]|uniref:TonB-dependent receptor n=1 Tax=Pseudidiomarina terrestris TaxID=2820060 RepID=A0AAW7QZJ3_9GAMM|nr:MULTISPECIES: TonB-dependent receptor [unclassified Pseudidiomarina]MDN7125621.1 TonB-dependent receptor [Pseudidiomarina sp. 1APP75-32.1]MDN7130515.1 TonB-dependent receptor [Pseudidiomarina sp. 1APR75-15]MDN7134157.1 TonB-dependent receptor [Pseudidiomarina sp. 1ASP75-5]